MHFEAPDAADRVNVVALNRSFLSLAAGRGRPAAALAEALCPEARERLAALDAVGRKRLARCPFLLFSLREDDDAAWREAFSDESPAELGGSLLRPADDEARLAAAALALLWQLARQCPYRARVVSGASVDWCERLAATTLAALMRHAWSRSDPLCWRFAERRRFWHLLLTAGTSAERPVRRAARLAALQNLLTQPEPVSAQLAAAACALPAPATRSAVSPVEQRRYNTRPHESTVDPLTHEDLRER